MKRSITKKIFLTPLTFLLGLFLASPIKIFAALPAYQPLEPNAFPGITLGPGTNLGQFLSQAFQFGLALAAALAVIMIVWGGVEIMLSESPFGKMDGKKKVWEAIWGLVLALVSWLILFTINPEILNFRISQ